MSELRNGIVRMKFAQAMDDGQLTIGDRGREAKSTSGQWVIGGGKFMNKKG
jgi:hypothetical protein